ncbi:MAG: hypothetical protein OEV44_15445, partial [Spirochaetota bacterium]|nr:hypothetical protein [Spirochaetota bacterium]
MSGLLFEPSLFVFYGLILFPIIVICFLKPKISVIFLLLSIMFTEFYWIEVMGGYLKPFHLVSMIMFLTFTMFYVKFLKHSRIFWLFIVFMLICLISIIFSGDWKDSLRSFISPLILFSIAMNIGMALYSQKINEDTFKKIILYGSFIVVIFGLIQMAGYRFADTLLTLTEVQNAQIVIAKRPPSFFTEADTFGKFLSLPFLFFLPFALDKNNKYHKKIRIIAVILLLGIIVNMTRSALVGIGLVGLIYVIYL